MRHAQILVKKNCWNKDRAMNLSISMTAKLTVIYAVALFCMATKQFNVKNVKFGFTMTALSSLILSMKLCKIQVVPEFI